MFDGSLSLIPYNYNRKSNQNFHLFPGKKNIQIGIFVTQTELFCKQIDLFVGSIRIMMDQCQFFYPVVQGGIDGVFH